MSLSPWTTQFPLPHFCFGSCSCSFSSSSSVLLFPFPHSHVLCPNYSSSVAVVSVCSVDLYCLPFHECTSVIVPTTLPFCWFILRGWFLISGFLNVLSSFALSVRATVLVVYARLCATIITIICSCAYGGCQLTT